MSTPLFSQDKSNISVKNNNYIAQPNEKSNEQKDLETCINETYIAKNWEQFCIYIIDHRRLVLQKKDSSAYAKNLFFSGLYHYKQTEKDSAYSYYWKSLQIYRKLKNSDEIGRSLLNIAIIEKDICDYKSSENTSVEAIKYLKKGKYKYKLVAVYNNMGLVLDHLKNTTDALKYHNKALKLKRKRNPISISVISSLNNIGNIYKDSKQYTLALEYYKQGLMHDSILNKYIKTKATLIDNYGYCLFQTGTKEIGFKLMKKALVIREQQNFKDGIAASNIHLAKYYAKMLDTVTAITHAERAERISKQTKNNEDYKDVLYLLVNLHKGKKIKEYYNKHKKFTDSLNQAQNKVKEQFGRIKFEINEQHEQELENQKQTNHNLKKRIIVFVLFLFIITLSIYFQKRIKKKRQTKIFLKGFRGYLIKKYKLTPENIEFWELWITGLDQKELSELLFISVDAVKSRRKSLKSKIDNIQTIEGNFTQTKAIHIYNLEKDIFRNFDQNSDT